MRLHRRGGEACGDVSDIPGHEFVADFAAECTRLSMANDLAIRRALDPAGIEFIDEKGVRLTEELRCWAPEDAARSSRWWVLLSGTVKGH
jgi:hypothetical protein